MTEALATWLDFAQDEYLQDPRDFKLQVLVDTELLIEYNVLTPLLKQHLEATPKLAAIHLLRYLT